MKKAAQLILCFCLILCLFGCETQQTPPATTLPDTTQVATEEQVTTTEFVTEPPTETPTEAPNVNTNFLGIDLRGMSQEKAYQTICDTLAHYRLQLTANNKIITFTAEDLLLTISAEEFANWFTAPQVCEPVNVLQYDLSAALQTVQDTFTSGVQDASINYNQKAGCFTLTAERTGKTADTSSVEETLANAIANLSPACKMTLSTTSIQPKVFSTDERIPAALESANNYLRISLTYVFEAPGVKKSTLKLSKATLSEFIAIDKDFQVSIDHDAIKTYITGLSSKYGGNHTKGKFVTTAGKEIDLTVEYYGAVLDHEALYQDLVYCLENHISDTRSAAFLSTETAAMPYGGSYVEIDMINQTLWVYKNGEKVVETPIVTGNISAGVRTPVGVYSIYEKKTDTWLVGKTFRDFVNYWIAFKGNYGIHDASWRDAFGGSIHKYNGSHGCVNLPPSIAGQVYNNVSIGTKVILYGFVSYPDFMDQELSGTDRYELTTQAAPFRLDVTAKYPATEITYRSSNSNVVTVDERGVVTVVGPGNATVTVTSAAVGVMRADTFKVQITVTEPEFPTTEPVTMPPEETTIPDESVTETTEPEATSG